MHNYHFWKILHFLGYRSCSCRCEPSINTLGFKVLSDRNPVSTQDLMPLSEEMESKTLSKVFEDTWDEQEKSPEKSNSQNRLLLCIITIFGRFFISSGIAHVLAGASLQLTPWALKYFQIVIPSRRKISCLLVKRWSLKLCPKFLKIHGMNKRKVLKNLTHKTGYYYA